MNKKSISKFLSLILRHKPEELGIVLNEEGWASTQELVSKMTAKGMNVNLEIIQEVVSESDKQRFKLSDDKKHIRANQGHSINVNLGLKSINPTDILFHGTALKNRESILEHGIKKRNRQHVHLSNDKFTALKVGQRHGKPLIFLINSSQMVEDGLAFYKSENGVWLTDYVAPKYLKFEN